MRSTFFALVRGMCPLNGSHRPQPRSCAMKRLTTVNETVKGRYTTAPAASAVRKIHLRSTRYFPKLRRSHLEEEIRRAVGGAELPNLPATYSRSVSFNLAQSSPRSQMTVVNIRPLPCSSTPCSGGLAHNEIVDPISGDPDAPKTKTLSPTSYPQR